MSQLVIDYSEDYDLYYYIAKNPGTPIETLIKIALWTYGDDEAMSYLNFINAEALRNPSLPTECLEEILEELLAREKKRSLDETENSLYECHNLLYSVCEIPKLSRLSPKMMERLSPYYESCMYRQQFLLERAESQLEQDRYDRMVTTSELIELSQSSNAEIRRSVALAKKLARCLQQLE